MEPTIKKPFESGEPLSKSRLNNFIYSILDSFIAGNGIRLNKFSDKMIISATDTGGSRGSGNMVIPIVATLPPIPTRPQGETIKKIYVFWGDSSTIAGGTGDAQIWVCVPGDTRYYPLEKFTSKSGVPV